MDPITAGLITGGSSLLGSIFSSSTNAANTQAQIQAQEQMQAQSEQFNAQQAEANREFQAQSQQQAEGFSAGQTSAQEQFQAQMSNTAYQRAVADMKRAGINPMLAYMQGGASTPSGAAASAGSLGGSTASVGTPSVPMPTRTSPFANIGDAVSKAISSAGAMLDMQKTMADTKYTMDAASLRRSEKLGVELQNQRMQGGPGAGPTETGVAESQLKQAQATSAKNTALQAQHEYDARNTPEGKIADQSAVYVKPLKDVVGVASDVAAPFISSAVRKQGMDMLREKMNRSQYRHTERYDERGNLTGSESVQSGLNSLP